MTQTTAAPLSQTSLAEPKNVSTSQELFFYSICMHLFSKNILTYITVKNSFPSYSAQLWLNLRVRIFGVNSVEGIPTLLHRAYCFSPRIGGEMSPAGQLPPPLPCPPQWCGEVVPMLNSSFSVTTSALGRMVGGGHLVSG